jgi:hypothetical protein
MDGGNHWSARAHASDEPRGVGVGRFELPRPRGAAGRTPHLSLVCPSRQPMSARLPGWTLQETGGARPSQYRPNGVLGLPLPSGGHGRAPTTVPEAPVLGWSRSGPLAGRAPGEAVGLNPGTLSPRIRGKTRDPTAEFRTHQGRVGGRCDHDRTRTCHRFALDPDDDSHEGTGRAPGHSRPGIGWLCGMTSILTLLALRGAGSTQDRRRPAGRTSIRSQCTARITGEVPGCRRRLGG